MPVLANVRSAVAPAGPLASSAFIGTVFRRRRRGSALERLLRERLSLPSFTAAVKSGISASGCGSR